MTKVHALFIQENPHRLYIGDTIKIESSFYNTTTSGFVYSINVFYSNFGEPYYIYYITSREEDIIRQAYISWIDDTGVFTSSESISSVTKKRLLLTERIRK